MPAILFAVLLRPSRDNIEHLMQCADKVMYRAKSSGRNRSLSHTDEFPAVAAVNSAVG